MRTKQGLVCMECSELHVSCPSSNMFYSSLPTEAGYLRQHASAHGSNSTADGAEDRVELYQCLDPWSKQRCPGTRGTECGKGYRGRLCQSCTTSAHETKQGCKLCKNTDAHAKTVNICVVISVLLAMLGIFCAIYCRRHRRVEDRSSNESREAGDRNNDNNNEASHEGDPDSDGSDWLHDWDNSHVAPSSAYSFSGFVMLQAGVLLQFFQIMNLALSLRKKNEEDLPEEPFFKFAQLSLDGWVDTFSLQCRWGYEETKIVSALSAPLLLPILCGIVLVVCGVSKNLPKGVQISLKLVTLLFIGGASGSRKILACQSQDGDGLPLGDVAFIKILPFLPCEGSGYSVVAQYVGNSGTLVHSVLIPITLLLLLRLQHKVVRSVKLDSVKANAVIQKDSMVVYVAYNDSGIQNLVDSSRRTEGMAKLLDKMDSLASLDDSSAMSMNTLTLMKNAEYDKKYGSYTTTAPLIASAFAGCFCKNLDCDVVNVSFPQEGEVTLAFQGTYDMHDVWETMEKSQELAMAHVEHERLGETTNASRGLKGDIIKGGMGVFLKYRSSEFVLMEILMKLSTVFFVMLQAANEKRGGVFTIKVTFALLCGVISACVWNVRPFTNHDHNTLWACNYACLCVTVMVFLMPADGGIGDKVLRGISIGCYVLPVALFGMQLLFFHKNNVVIADRVFKEMMKDSRRLRGEVEPATYSLS